MNRALLMSMSVIAAAAITIVGCGGGGSSKTIKTDNGNLSVSSSKKLPDSFPSDFPVYSGADVQGSYTGTQNGISGTVVSWQTGDSFDKVQSFYDSAFSSGAWKATVNGTAGQTAYWASENASSSKGAYVTVSASGDTTMIIAAVGDKEGGPSAASTSASSDGGSATEAPSSGSTASSAQLPAETQLPSDYPKDRVPIPSGARVTQATSTSAGGKKTYVIELYVKGSTESVANNIKSDLSSHGWSNTVNSQAAGQYFVSVSNANDESVTATVTESDVTGYAQVNLLVAVSG